MRYPVINYYIIRNGIDTAIEDDQYLGQKMAECSTIKEARAKLRATPFTEIRDYNGHYINPKSY